MRMHWERVRITWKKFDNLKARRCWRSFSGVSFVNCRNASVLNVRICSFNRSSGQSKRRNSVRIGLLLSCLCKSLERTEHQIYQWIIYSTNQSIANCAERKPVATHARSLEQKRTRILNEESIDFRTNALSLGIPSWLISKIECNDWDEICSCWLCWSRIGVDQRLLLWLSCFSRRSDVRCMENE